MFKLNLDRKKEESVSDLGRYLKPEGEHLGFTNSEFLFRLSSLPSFGVFRVVDPLRADAVSFQIYGTVRYWWLILHYNNIVDPWKGLKMGDVIRYPSQESIQNLFYELRSSERMRAKFTNT